MDGNGMSPSHRVTVIRRGRIPRCSWLTESLGMSMSEREDEGEG